MILKDLLALHKNESDAPPAKQIAEARGGDLHELIDKWCEQNKAYSWEGSRGGRNFEKLIGVLGYSSMDTFFEDNPGAYQALIEWLGEMRNSEWTEALEADIGGDDEDEDDEDK